MIFKQDQILNMEISQKFLNNKNYKIDLELVLILTGYFAVSFASIQQDQTISRLSKMRFK